MSNAGTYTMTLPGPMIQKGFWLYVWRVTASDETEWLYVGRTGDNSSPNANAPFTRMGQHLSMSKHQNALRKRLEDHQIEVGKCSSFQLVAHGPIHPEVEGPEGSLREHLMALHKPLRDEVGAYERDLADALERVGYNVLNKVNWKRDGDGVRWKKIKHAFSEHFPKLDQQTNSA